MSANMKRCNICDTTKPHAAFAKDRSRKDGLQLRCRECFAAYSATNRDKTAARDAARYAERKAAGLCVKCGAPADGGSVHCTQHRTEVNTSVAAWQRARYAEAAAEGRCVWQSGRGCQEPAESGIHCPAHRAEAAERHRIRSLKPVLTEARAGLASWEARDLWRCTYCAAPFDEVEHMVARNSADGVQGSNAPGNLVPACWSCNSRKSNTPYAVWIAAEFPHVAHLLKDLTR